MTHLLQSEQQTHGSQQRRVPVAVEASTVTAALSTPETVLFQYYNSGVLTVDAGEVAGSTIVFNLVNNKIKNALGDTVGTYNDTSFAFVTGTVLDTLVEFRPLVAEKYDRSTGTIKAEAIVKGFAEGEFCIDHEAGVGYGKKATTGVSDTASYIVSQSATSGAGPGTDDVNIAEVGGVAVTELPTDIEKVGGVDVVNGTLRTEEVDPLSLQYANDSLVDTTNVSAATHYYPSATGMSMDGFKNFSISGKLIDADGTLTLTVEMTNDEDTTSGDWNQMYGYDDINKVVANSWTVTNGTLKYGVSFNSANYRNIRIAVVASGATNTVISKARRIAL